MTWLTPSDPVRAPRPPGVRAESAAMAHGRRRHIEGRDAIYDYACWAGEQGLRFQPELHWPTATDDPGVYQSYLAGRRKRSRDRRSALLSRLSAAGWWLCSLVAPNRCAAPAAGSTSGGSGGIPTPGGSALRFTTSTVRRDRDRHDDLMPRAEAEAVAYKLAAEKLAEALQEARERIVTLRPGRTATGQNDNLTAGM